MSVNLNPSSYISDVFSSKPLRGSFQENSQAFGPVAASAVGVAQAAAGVADSTVTLSTKAMEELCGAVRSTTLAVGDAVEGAAHLAGDGVDALEHAAGSACDGVAGFVEDAARSIGHAATALYDSVASGASTVAGYAAAGGQAISELL